MQIKSFKGKIKLNNKEMDFYFLLAKKDLLNVTYILGDKAYTLTEPLTEENNTDYICFSFATVEYIGVNVFEFNYKEKWGKFGYLYLNDQFLARIERV